MSEVNQKIKDKVKENLKSACAKEENERIVKVAKILEGVKYSSESERAEAIVSFSRSKLSEDEIEKLAVTMRPSYLEFKNAQVFKRGVY